MTTPQEIALMKSIRDKFHVEIQQVAAGSSVPAEFLAALVAGESGGRPDAKRFERGVLASLWEVLQGRAANFGSIGRSDLLTYILPIADPRTPLSQQLTTAMQRLDSLATSWGLTQIMGYEAIPFGVDAGTFTPPLSSLHYTCRMLADFAAHKGLDLTKDFSELLDCWNTGRPHAPTADPAYIPNGLARMAIYRDLGPLLPADPARQGQSA